MHESAPLEPVTMTMRSRVLRIEWLGQTAASACWIASVFSYGVTSAGDYLQLAAASAWLLANLSALRPSSAG